MDILHTLRRHSYQIEKLKELCERRDMTGIKYLIVAVDGPESVNRQASWASDFNAEDTHKMFQALADQTKP